MSASGDIRGDAGTMDVEAIALEAYEVLGTGRQVAPFSARVPSFDLHQAYQVAALVRAKREARGERPIGRKIGFTNRTIWAEYNVHAPIWGYVYDTTVHDLGQAGTRFSLKGFAQPRIEPEIVFGLAEAPSADMDERALLRCIEWVAHGFEIVQSIFPGWAFLAPDTAAGYGLHGALLIGPRETVRSRRADWERDLGAFDIDLFRDGSLVDHGVATNVLDGPLSALRHLVELLARDPAGPPLAAGEIVTTGTLTRAFPVAAGETWTTELAGVQLDGADLRFI